MVPADAKAAKRKVILIGPLPPPANGMTVVTQILLQSRLAEDFDLIHFDTSDHRDISNVARLESRNVLLALWHGLTFFLSLARYRPDIVYVQIARNRLGFLRDALFLLPARVSRRTIVLHLHSRDFRQFVEGERWWMRLLVRTALGRQAHAVVLSPMFACTFEPFVDRRRIHVVPNGLAGGEVGLPANDRPPTVLHLSTLWSLKGLFEVIHAASRVTARLPAARFIFAGDWFCEEEREQALQLIERLGLASAVDFTGPVFGRRKEELLAAAAVFVLPTRHPTEGQPLVVIEALAAGTPVIATRIGAIPDMIRDGREGFLVAPEDVDGLADRIVEVLTKPELRARLGAAARTRYESDYTMDRFAKRLGDVWHAAIAPRRSEA